MIKSWEICAVNRYTTGLFNSTNASNSWVAAFASAETCHKDISLKLFEVEMQRFALAIL
jgi:hypothetical protein